MSQQRRGLGKGLGALIPQGPVATAAGNGTPGAGAVPETVGGAYLEEVPLKAISPNPRQPRQHFDEDALAELKASISEVGLLQPVVVRKIDDGQYELIMGERRWRASKEAGLDRIPAIVRQTSDDDLLRDALLENLHRQQLNPLEEAAAYQQLLDDFGTTHDELARRIGRSRPHITNTLRLLNLPPAVQRRVAAGVISAGHARALLSAEGPELQDRLAQRIVAEGLSVRALEEIIALGVDDDARPERRKPVRAPVSPQVEELANRLSDVFDTRVKVNMGRNKGKIVVEFATMEDLERIIETMAPTVRQG
ncbi:ParB/RepB/Spo0J family partition protein [Marinactinospora thermotolerans]|uniref:Chromosome segregation DNA-binding protein n=1 Tax=Marinactinospora thermotolerans DSM 45154 TaxID=1122192 RepID=A0A1T4RDW7_9ACTN|nr:ParB/RepB/Spo0J family partition protein [Marinactinospora thermotolerans]SKA13996.1 chromosome segregation DNA-binding protein [Marinactinospora thermotolerans DSM 45154]